MLAEVTFVIVTVDPAIACDGIDIAPGLFAVEFTVIVLLAYTVEQPPVAVNVTVIFPDSPADAVYWAPPGLFGLLQLPLPPDQVPPDAPPPIEPPIHPEVPPEQIEDKAPPAFTLPAVQGVHADSFTQSV